MSSPTSDPNIERLCSLFSDLARERTETPESSPRYRVTATWRTEMRRLLTIDGRDPVEVEAAIRWVHTDPFWSSNVLSVPALRRQYDRLRVKAQRRRPESGVDRMLRIANEEAA